MNKCDIFMNEAIKELTAIDPDMIVHSFKCCGLVVFQMQLMGQKITNFRF